MKKEKIIIGSDHAGFKLKEKIKEFLNKLGYECEDLGTYNEKLSDYPEIALKVAKKVAESNGRGILLCGTGLGEAIVANKIKGIRATNCFDGYAAKMARSHNNSNLLCLGARILNLDEAKKITKIWLTTEFSNEERHRRRVSQIKEIEDRICK